MKLVLSYIIALSLILGINTYAQDEEFQELYEEYVELNQKLQFVQQQAMADENVSIEAEEYSDFVDSFIQQIDSKAATLIEERNKTIDALYDAQEKGDYESLQGLQQSYQKISEDLAPYFEMAMLDEKVIERREKFESKLIAKMEEIEPDTQNLLDRLYEVAEKLEKMIEQQ